MTDRIPLDAMTSDQLDTLYGELEQHRAAARQCNAQQWPQRLATAQAQIRADGVAMERLRQRAEMAEPLLNDYRAELTRAEAAIARVREFLDRDQDGLCCSHVTGQLRALLNGPEPADTDTTQPEPATVTDPAWLCQQYAKAIADDDGHPWDTLTADRQESYLDNADAVMRVRDRHVAQLRQRLELAAEWTPPPPGSTREQLPDHLLDLIRDRLPDYLSTACQTADTLACAACYPGSGVPRPQYDEIREHAERLHNRCRLNNKFTGQLCGCGCHPTEEQATVVGGGR